MKIIKEPRRKRRQGLSKKDEAIIDNRVDDLESGQDFTNMKIRKSNKDVSPDDLE